MARTSPSSRTRGSHDAWNSSPVADERAGLLAYLAQQRDGLRFAAYGLTDEQARQTPTASALSIGGLVKHVATTEQGWVDIMLSRESGASETSYDENFGLSSGETLAGALAFYDQVADATASVIADLDLDQPVPVPDEPWYPKDVEAWSVRWVVMHLIEETARHAGHADIVRESIDGATSYALMAAAEGWPETPWIKPWTPAATTTS